jgi:hypothetical protein
MSTLFLGAHVVLLSSKILLVGRSLSLSSEELGRLLALLPNYTYATSEIPDYVFLHSKKS